MKEGEEEMVAPTAPAPAPSADRKTQRGMGSRIWGLMGSLFSRGNKNDFEKKLQHLSKEEVTVHTRLKRRTQRWRKLARVMIIYSVIGEALALGFAILSNRTADLPWNVRAIRALPVFASPVIVALLYSTCAGYHRMMERKDNDRLERLKAERQEKINELKERTNYYITQQLIQQYDPDPASKAAAASILASKLGAESGLKLALAAGLTSTEDLDAQRKSQGAPNQQGNRLDGEVMHPTGLRNRRSQHRSQVAGPDASQGMSQMEAFSRENNIPGDMGRASEVWEEQGMDVRGPPRNPSNGGWIARLAAMLVGEDPTQCYALICKRCHAHNGLAKKEDYKYIQYYCPHCQTLNGMRSPGDGLSLTDEPAETSPKPEETKATSTVDGERPDISDSAAPALISQIISGELDQSHSSNESS
ncbi:uncharacterized protein At2g24330 [Physcomitrium patens]|uniref:Lunapark zinc ribbon domain-containing protein n=1 Tax=Physcomitrium patens TaxID=3218 RepID=A0A2K1LAD1_PHYPA|nr:uncharacterized protein At2g24330-like [Physcomitrium patens]PNR62992.1 hypothetical protein PHYPA_001417 [Physcomitrium patens]|eukprot:XP_024395040.1 uncharacterized protein At2g24330-like [Physcomitrella patens]